MKYKRIVKRRRPSGRVLYVIQSKHWLLGWLDDSRDEWYFSYETFEEAEKSLRFLIMADEDEVVKEVSYKPLPCSKP